MLATQEQTGLELDDDGEDDGAAFHGVLHRFARRIADAAMQGVVVDGTIQGRNPLRRPCDLDRLVQLVGIPGDPVAVDVGAEDDVSAALVDANA